LFGVFEGTRNRAHLFAQGRNIAVQPCDLRVRVLFFINRQRCRPCLERLCRAFVLLIDQPQIAAALGDFQQILEFFSGFNRIRVSFYCRFNVAAFRLRGGKGAL